MNERRTIRYSEAFKLQVINELATGQLDCVQQAREKYGINGSATIPGWLKKYGRRDILPKRVRIEMPDEKDQVKKLKARIRKLEKALADAKVKEVLDQAYFEIVCEEAGIKDPEVLKKKLDQQLLDEE